MEAAMNRVIEREIVDRLARMSEVQQTRVLEFVRTLETELPDGMTPAVLLEFAGSISTEDAEEMKKAINEGCEGIDSNEW